MSLKCMMFFFIFLDMIFDVIVGVFTSMSNWHPIEQGAGCASISAFKLIPIEEVLHMHNIHYML